jgi:hypothetical protein
MPGRTHGTVGNLHGLQVVLALHRGWSECCGIANPHSTGRYGQWYAPLASTELGCGRWSSTSCLFTNDRHLLRAQPAIPRRRADVRSAPRRLWSFARRGTLDSGLKSTYSRAFQSTIRVLPGPNAKEGL